MPEKSKHKIKVQKQFVIAYGNGSVDVIKAKDCKAAKKQAIQKLRVLTSSKWRF